MKTKKEVIAEWEKIRELLQQGPEGLGVEKWQNVYHCHRTLSWVLWGSGRSPMEELLRPEGE
jgi:hypothetical protein